MTAALQGDAASGSFRLAGWFDYLASAVPTSPIIWYGTIPWWANLSFHDHPPVVFLIQRIFFLFGDTTFLALLPFVLAGVVTTYLVYLILKPTGNRVAAAGSTLYAIASYAVWGSRTGYLEGIAVVFITASLLFLMRFLEQGKKKDFYWWVSMVALAIASKYTTLFLLPAGLILIAIYRRSLFRLRSFWLGALLFVALLSPVIIFNGMLLATRGHFDATLSSMVGMHPTDYASISERGTNFNILTNASSLGITLATNMSLPLLLLALLSCILLIVRALRKKNTILDNVVLVTLIFMIILFCFSGAAVRFLSIFMPFFCIAIIRSAHIIVRAFPGKLMVRKITMVVLAITAILELGYSVNTNLVVNPTGPVAIAYAAGRQESTGFQNLENYLRQEPLHDPGDFKRPKTLLGDSTTYQTAGKQIILMDVRTDWFSRMWYVRRFDVYHRVPIIYTTDLFASYQQSGFKGPIIAYVKATEASKVWLVVATGGGIRTDTDATYDKQLDDLIGWVESYGVKPVVITTNDGQPAFNVYHFSFEK